MKKPERRKLPDTRASLTHKVKIETEQGPLSVYFQASFYEDGRVGEIFISAGKVGSTVRGLLNDLARSVSYALQYGIPADDLFQRMTGANYPPQGRTENEALPMCSSITDYMFRWLLSIQRKSEPQEEASQ